MIELHRLGRDLTAFYLNPDLIVTIEAHPDTVVHLSTGVNLVVHESPDEVVAEVRAWRRSINPITALPQAENARNTA